MKPEQISIQLNQIAQLEISSEYEAAMDIVRSLLDTAKPGPRVIEAYARLCVHFDEQDKALEKIEALLMNNTLMPQVQSGLQFQAGNLYDGLGEYDKAFQHYKSANDLLPMQFDVRIYEPFIDTMCQFYSKSSMQSFVRANESEKVPVFIVGMPRSGTTLTEQILDRHTKIHGAGELTTINELVVSLQQQFSFIQPYPACLSDLTNEHLNKLANQYLSVASSGNMKAACVTDKMPSNCGHLGFIELVLPKAKVIHCRRHPIDTCLSCFFQNFSNTHQYSRRLDDLAKMYRIYLRMVEMWDGVISIPVHELRYEDMVKDHKRASEELIEFTGFDWEEQCLTFNESQRDINTCSYNQVRKPIYTSSVNRWQNYENHIEPLLVEMRDIVDEYESSSSIS